MRDQHQKALLQQTNPLVAVCLCALLFLSCFLLAPQQQAYAEETGEAQAQEEGSTEETEGVDYHTFDGQDIIDAQTNQSEAVIPDSVVPLASSSSQFASDAKNGSIYNTVLAVLSILSMLAMLVLLSVRKTGDYRVIALRTIAATFGLVTVATWSLIDGLQIPVALFNGSSILITALFCVYAALAVVSYLIEARLSKQQEKRARI